MKRQRTLLLAIAILAALALDLALSTLHYEYARRHYSGKPLQSVDAVVVLFSGSSSDGALNAETRRRLAWASLIYRLGLARAIICSGGSGRGATFGALRMRAHLVADRIPGASVMAESLSFDTITNIRRSGTIANEHNWKRIAIITSPPHAIRALRIARAERLDAIPAAYEPHVATPPVGWFEAYAQIHHEWLAIIGSLLPETTYLRTLERWRLKTQFIIADYATKTHRTL